MSTSTGYFSSDRAIKYGWGIPRLAVLIFIAFEVAPRLSAGVTSEGADGLGLLAYLQSGRWLAHAYIGSIGAAVNVQVLGLAGNIGMLLIAAALILWDLRIDYAILIYMAKTFSGDFIAGKLDTTEWKLVLLFTCAVGAAAWFFEAQHAPSAYAPYARILPTLAIIQLICEMGDNYLEHWKFFRHRYSFEIFNAAVLFGFSLSPVEFAPLHHDLVICWFYRLSNGAIILAKSGELMLLVRRLAFRAFGLLRGMRLQVVSDVDTAMAVLRASVVKGEALERLIATPAWSPVLSLESIDGPLYHAMIKDFHSLVSLLPPPATLHEIARSQVAELIKSSSSSGRPIDAEAIAHLSVRCFVRYLFGHAEGKDRDVTPPYLSPDKEAELVGKLVAGSWEWRKEIAVRGPAIPLVKLQAIEALLTLLEGSQLWGIHGANWRQPRFYSLLMQPFLLSPAINIGDICVALKTHPSLSPEEAMRTSHPFPILERFVGENGVRTRDGRLAVKPNTQVIIFTTDFVGSAVKWPVFGAGPRACAGTNFALPLIKLLHEELLPHAHCRPALNHRYSGRNNDEVWSVGELSYFAGKVASVLMGRVTLDDGSGMLEGVGGGGVTLLAAGHAGLSNGKKGEWGNGSEHNEHKLLPASDTDTDKVHVN